jgi:hypothetical protein
VERVLCGCERLVAGGGGFGFVGTTGREGKALIGFAQWGGAHCPA